MKKSTVRVVDKIEITRKGSFIYFDFHGTGFLQNMVRILVGTLLEVGKGKIKPEQIPDILEAENKEKGSTESKTNHTVFACKTVFLSPCHK